MRGSIALILALVDLVVEVHKSDFCQCWKLIYEFRDCECERHRLAAFDLIRFGALGLNENYKCDLFVGFAKQSDTRKDLLAAFTAATSSADGATADGEEGS